jgi:hypothetical protein
MRDVACLHLLQLDRISRCVLSIGTIGVRHRSLLPAHETVGALRKCARLPGLAEDGIRAYERVQRRGPHRPRITSGDPEAGGREEAVNPQGEVVAPRAIKEGAALVDSLPLSILGVKSGPGMRATLRSGSRAPES